MQDYVESCAIIDQLFRHKTTSIIKSCLTPQFWVVNFYSWGDLEEIGTLECIGVFTDEWFAVQATLKYLKLQDCVRNDPFQTFSLHQSLKSNQVKENTEKLNPEKITSEQDLVLACKEYGNGLYLLTWDVEFTVQELNVPTIESL